MKIKVSGLTQILGQNDDIEVFDDEVEGSITIPPEASFSMNGVVWLQTDHITDKRCKRCISNEPCLQHIQLSGQDIFIIHDWQGEEGEPLS